MQIKFERNKDDTLDQYKPFMTESGIQVCCCGYELYKVDENTWRCTGGNHVYRLDEGDIIQDKFGNLLFRKPTGDDKTKGAENSREKVSGKCHR